MAKGRKTGGRQAGTPNRFNKTVKENILAVFVAIGDIKNMAAWAQENPSEFYRLYNSHKDSDKPEIGSKDNPFHGVIELP
jgi:hypothetical protein